MFNDVMYGGTITLLFINDNICFVFRESVPIISLTITSEIDFDLESIEISIEYWLFMLFTISLSLIIEKLKSLKLERSNPSWKFNYAMANDVIQADGSADHWVTSLYTLTDTVNGEEVVREEMFDVQIENGKIKNIMVASRAVISEE